jgi:hypothetical protein
MNVLKRTLICCLVLLVLSSQIWALRSDDDVPSIDEFVKEMELREGFFDFYWESRSGKIWLLIPRFGEDFLYVNSLATGLGSNPIGLDRSQLGRSRVVHFERVGQRVLMVEPNLRFRAVTDDPAERRAVEESFAESVLWGAKVAAEEGESVLVDGTDFLMRDAHNVIGRLKRSNQGAFSLDRARSAFYRDRTRNFPDNTEFEATLTFSSPSPGGLVSEVAPSAEVPWSSRTMRLRSISLSKNGGLRGTGFPRLIRVLICLHRWSRLSTTWTVALPNPFDPLYWRERVGGIKLSRRQDTGTPSELRSSLRGWILWMFGTT